MDIKVRSRVSSYLRARVLGRQLKRQIIRTRKIEKARLVCLTSILRWAILATILATRIWYKMFSWLKEATIWLFIRNLALIELQATKVSH